MTIFFGGPATTDAEGKLLADVSGRVFRMPSYGQPALAKLLNNALATYNLAATAGAESGGAARNTGPDICRSDRRVDWTELDE
jgi:3-hydroxyisobutyrate dehydrogenase-like beta-hydroxyacid dehydrogenase